VFKLSIEDDEGKTTVVPLARDEMTVGRLEGNTIRLTERNISRKHARLTRQNGALFIEDLTSFNGVRVNGTKIASPTPLREGDEVQLGDYKLVLRGDRPPIGDRQTMPNIPAVTTAPLATLGGAVAIPTRASVAAMAAQPAPQAVAPVAAGAPAAATPPRSRTKTSPPKPMTAVPESGAVVEPVEGQPTIPLRALTDKSGAGGQGAVGPAARLVVLTTDLAGMEIALDKASLVIGRTDENDVLLNHRSISRHHAKIVRDAEHYTIVDLQSANGVRVNGEDYERIELNAGDVVELGHVKLRFVSPGEDFIFDPDAHQPRQLPMKMIAVGGGAIAVVLLAVLFLRRGSHESTPAMAEAPAQPAPPAAAVVAPPVAPAPAPPAAPPPPETPIAILAAAKKAMVAEDWETAETDLGRINGVDDPAIKREVTALGHRVENERLAASMFAKFDEAANTKNYAAALSGYAQIPAESVYKRRAQPRYEEARTLLVAEHMTAAEKDRAEGRCAEVRVEAAEVIRLEPKNQLIRDLSRLCRARPESVATARSARTRTVAAAAPAAVERPERSEPAKHSEPARTEPTHAEAAAEPEDAEALMKQAREAWLRQQCGAAMDLSRRALRAKPGWTDAYQILAVCSCSLKDAEAAERAYSRLDDKNRTLVHAVCQKNGIAVGD
jgi:pSer/pThr/pTyr-binding forkhead associated (FHA) protein